MNIKSDKYQKQISSIYEQYNKIVAPMVSFLEVIDAEFPIEILNEVRAIFGHFAKTYDDNISIQDIDIELNKAQGHLKRAILDCYKYGCVSLNDFYQKFRKEYHFADLTNIDNGDFLSQITEWYSSGKKALISAKLAERKSVDSDDLYQKFEEAFKLFLKIYNLINKKLAIVHKVEKKAKWKNFWGTFGFWISLLSFVISILSFMLF